MAELTKSSGTVRWFSGQKGFGFISPDDGGEDLFVHQTEILSDGFRVLREGQRVEFRVDSGVDGRSKAVEVVGLPGSYSSGGRRGGGGGGAFRGGGGRGGYERYGGGRGAGGGGGGGYGRGGGGDGGGEASGVECYNCGRIGHLARDCYRTGGGGNRGYGGSGGWGYSGRGRGGGGRGGGGGGGRGSVGGGSSGCYNCGEEGHIARACHNL